VPIAPIVVRSDRGTFSRSPPGTSSISRTPSSPCPESPRSFGSGTDRTRFNAVRHHDRTDSPRPHARRTAPSPPFVPPLLPKKGPTVAPVPAPTFPAALASSMHSYTPGIRGSCSRDLLCRETEVVMFVPMIPGIFPPPVLDASFLLQEESADAADGVEPVDVPAGQEERVPVDEGLAQIRGRRCRRCLAIAPGHRRKPSREDRATTTVLRCGGVDPAHGPHGRPGSR